MISSIIDRLGISGDKILNILKFCKSTNNDNMKSYPNTFFTSMNIFFEDGSVDNMSNSNFIDFNYNLERSWFQWNRGNIDFMVLPTTNLDSKTVLNIITKAMVNVIMIKVSSSDDERVLDTIIPRSILRWTLTMNNLFTNSINYFENSNSTDLLVNEKIKLRMLSVIDGGNNVIQYTKSFSEFQLLFQLTILTIVSFVLFGEETSSLKLVFIKSLKVLTMSNVSLIKLNPKQSIVLILRDISHGFDIWNNCNNKAAVIEICLLVLDLVGAVVSIDDKYDKSEIQADYINKNGPIRLEKLCNTIKFNDDDNDKFNDNNNDDNNNDNTTINVNSTFFNSRFFGNCNN